MVLALILISWAGVQGLGLTLVFGVIIPYAAFVIFIFGFLRRIIRWSGAPNPFPIPTTGGQQKGLDWIGQSKIDNPFTTGQVVIRMFCEVFLFRSLFRNLAVRPGEEGRPLTYASAKWLWLFAMVFHYAMFITLFRHLHFFTNPVLWPVRIIQGLDGWLEIGVPQVMVSGLVLPAAISLLLARRLFISRLRYISLLNDYFPLFLIMAIAITGALMRYFVGIDTTGVKELVIGLVTLRPVLPEGIGALFFIHIFLVCALLSSFPFSKLMHAAGIFFSPTRGRANNSRALYHKNPWAYPVDFHKYRDYEEEFREKLVQAGIPLDSDQLPVDGKEPA